MNTSIVLLAMSGAWLANIPVAATWERDYRAARLVGEKQQKPLAIFFGGGDVPWRQLTREGKPDRDIIKILSEQYVRVYINTETLEGRELAQAFGLAGTRGLIISDRSGDLQAFRYDGDVAAQDLTLHLTRFGHADHIVSATEGNVPVLAPTPVHHVNYPPPWSGVGACRT